MSPKPLGRPKHRNTALIGLILFQTLCAAYFVIDVVVELKREGLSGLTDGHLIPEMAATLGLFIGIAFEVRSLLRMQRRQADMERSLGVAAGALADLIDAYFQTWGLTQSEQDVAGFTIKGYSIAEIAAMRGSAEGTVKSHLNGIYRKAGVAGRAQLVSLLIEDLMRAPLVGKP